MFAIDDIKLCFIDFDDSMSVRINREPEPDYHKSIVLGDWQFYNRAKRTIGKGMSEFVNTCVKENIPVYILTWSNSSLVVKTELKWLESKLGQGKIEDVIVASSKEYKIEILKHFAEAYNLAYKKILLVDDVPDTLDRAYAAGFSVASPQEVALVYG